MKEITCDHHCIGSGGDHAIDRAPKSLCDVGLALINAGRGLPVILSNSKVRISDVGQFHGWRMGPNALKSKKLTYSHTVPIDAPSGSRWAG
jgi:hypothetical protein